MKFLVDESVDHPITQRLRLDGFDVLSIQEMTPGISDDLVLAIASQEQRILVTADKDFGELVVRQQRKTAGVILIRLAGLGPKQKAALVANIVREHEHEVPDAFMVISRRSVRIRRLDL